MSRVIRIALAGLLGGVIVHIVVILLFPAIGSNDAWGAMEAYGTDGQFAVLPQPEPGVAARAFLDPATVHAVCRFDRLSERPLRIIAELGGTFWSAAVFDRGGRNLFSVNDRTAGSPLVDLLLIGPADLTTLQRTAALVLEEAVVVDLAVDSGLVVLRVFAGDPTMLPGIRAMLAAANCNAPIEVEPPVMDVPAGPVPGVSAADLPAEAPVLP